MVGSKKGPEQAMFDTTYSNVCNAPHCRWPSPCAFCLPLQVLARHLQRADKHKRTNMSNMRQKGHVDAHSAVPSFSEQVEQPGHMKS
jgi:hypothetical protein